MNTPSYLRIFCSLALILLSQAGRAEMPDLQPIDFEVPSTISGPPGVQVSLAYVTTNRGDMPALNYWEDRIYLSTKPQFDSSAVLAYYGYHYSWLEELCTVRSEILLSMPTTNSGLYYLFLQVDAGENIAEYEECNNQISRSFTYTSAYPNLGIARFEVPAKVTGAAPPKASYSVTFTNMGAVGLRGTWVNRLYWSSDAVLDSGDVEVGNFYRGTSISAGGILVSEGGITISALKTNGSGWIIIQADGWRDLPDSELGNNVAAAPFSFELVPPDLQPINLHLTNSTLLTAANPYANAWWNLTNSGPGNLSDRQLIYEMFLSTNASMANAVRLGEMALWGPLAEGQATEINSGFTLPATESGRYYLSVVVDPQNELIETDENNNIVVIPLDLDIRKHELAIVPSFTQTNFTGAQNPHMEVVFSVTNSGPLDAYNVCSGVFFSNDPVLDGSDPLLNYSYNFVASHGCVTHTNVLRLPATASSVCWLIKVADIYNYLSELNETNNIQMLAADVTVLLPDLEPISLQAPAVYSGPEGGTFPLVCTVTNRAPALAMDRLDWMYTVYLSTNGLLDDQSLPLSVGWMSAPLAGFSKIAVTNNVTVPAGVNGNARLFVRVNSTGSVLELNTNNNVISSPLQMVITPPDLIPFAVSVPSVVTGPPQPQVNLVWGVTNAGPGAVLGWHISHIYFSTNATLETEWDASVDAVWGEVPLAPGTSELYQKSVTVPVTNSMSGYLLFVCDLPQLTSEVNETNNLLAVPLSFVINRPDLVALPLVFPAQIADSPEPQRTLVWGVSNAGPTTIEATTVANAVYVSRNNRLDYWDRSICQQRLSSNLLPGQSIWFTNQITLPITNSGNWHLVLKADIYQSLDETNELNNTSSLPFSASISYPDLAAAPLDFPSDLAYTPNSKIGVTLGATNVGPGSIAPGWNDEIWISRRPVLDDKAVQLISSYVSQELAPGQGYAKVHQLTLPISESGTYYLLATVGGGLDWDSDLTNNEVVKPLNVQITPADLQPVVFTGPAPSTVLPNPTLQFVAGVTNRGPGAACPNGSRVDALVFSRDAVLDASDELITSQEYFGEQQPAQSMVWATNSVTLPIKESGTYYFFWVADYTQTIPESNESNNVLMTTVTLTVTHPDLAPVYFEIPSALSAPPFPYVKLVYAVTNYGPGAAKNQSWGHVIYRAETPESKISLYATGNNMPPGGVYWITNVVRLPMSSSGSYDIVFEVNPYRTLFESDYANNTVTNHIVYTAVLPDLAPVRLTAPATWTIPEDRAVTVSYGITNASDNMVIPANSWSDIMYLSRDPFPSRDDRRCFDSYRYPIMEPHSTAWFSETVSLPSVPPGSYHLVLVVNAGQGLIESSVTNNVLALPITVRERKPDLAPQQLIAPAIITNPVSSCTFQWYVVNQGLGAIPRNVRWYDHVFLSSDPSPPRLAWKTGPLLPGIGYWVTNTSLVVVTNDGDHKFTLRTSPDGYLFEENNANNTLSVPVKVRLSKPDLAVIDVEAPLSIMADPCAPFEVRWGITNAGPGATRPDMTILTGVTYTGSEDINEWNASFVQCPALPPGGSAHFTNTLHLPQETTNSLKVVFKVDPDGYQVELTRTNNQIEKIIPVTVRYPDLAVSIVSYPTNLVFSPRQPLEFVYAITNIGNGVAQFPHGDALYDTLSMSNVLGEIVDPVESSSLAALAPGEGLRRTNVIRMYDTFSSGPAIARIVVNSEQAPLELNWANNILELPMQCERRPADLAVSLSIMETNATGSNPFLKFRWAVTNLGPGDFYPVDEEQIRFGLSSPPNSWVDVDLFDIPLNSNIPVGGEINGTNTIALSQFGEELLYLVMGIEGWGEVTDTNNTALAPFYLDNLPDLAIMTFIAPEVLSGAPNQQVKLIIEVKNKGTGAVKPYWNYWTFIRSAYTDVQIDAYRIVKDWLSPGDSRWFTNMVKVPALASGSYRWQTGVNFSPDANTANNSLELPVQVNLSRPSQLRAASLTADAQATLTIPYADIRWSAVNDGDSPTAFDWVDSVYYSLDNQFSLDDTPVTARTNLAGLASGATYTWQTFVTLPSDAKSGAFLVLGVDRDRALWDEDVANNFIAVPLRIAPFGTGHTWMSEPRFVNGRFQATLHGAEGLSVVLQASTNLVDWESLRTVTFPNDGLDIEDTNSEGTASRFYRLIPLSELD